MTPGEFWKTTPAWERWALVALICFVGGAMFGHFSAPTRVETKASDVQARAKQIAKEIAEHDAETSGKSASMLHDRTVITRPDGTVIHRNVNLAKRETAATKSTDKTTVSIQTQIEYRDREITKLVESVGPMWSVSISVGVTPLHLLTPKALGPLELTGAVEHRLWRLPAFVGLEGRWDGSPVPSYVGLRFRLEW